MNNEKQKLIIGSLCHDLGKVLYRDYSVTNHSDMGYEFLKDEIGINDKDILDQVKYHHSSNIKNSNIADNSLAYITYIADNIASMSDRREDISKNEKDEKLYDKHIRLKSVFNKINNNDSQQVYDFGTLDDKEGIKVPIDEAKINRNIDDSFYSNVVLKIKDCFNQIVNENKEIREEYINSLIEVLEANLSLVPSSTDTNQVSDISLFDHLKITASYASCIYDYIKSKGVNSFKSYLYDNAQSFYDEKAFLILNLDLSGIQDFIYMHNNESGGMLKSLRTRSFYLEILLENIVDELLSELELSRANAIYIGGGHAYLMIPNTTDAINKIETIAKEVNKWFINTFDIRLFLAYGYSECSANDLSGKNSESYNEVFRKSQVAVSTKKMSKFSFEDIMRLNREQINNGERECSICRKTDDLITNENGTSKCKICTSIENISYDILNKDFFVVVKVSPNNELKSLPLPFDQKLVFKTEEEAKTIANTETIRVYCKNTAYTGKLLSKKINFADYFQEDCRTFEDLAKASYGGYKKIAVFRADVDNLGETFINGLRHKKYGTQFMTLSRNATFSRMMSLFFKKYINNICKDKFDDNYIVDLEERNSFIKKNNRKVSGHDIAIIYSGGDDIFAVGAWDEIVNFAIQLYYRFKEFSQGTLTFSCGIGMYNDSFPISLMSRMTGELEDVSKGFENKNAITLFDSPINNEFENTYHFEGFIENVICNKYETIKSYFKNNQDKGRNFLYKLMEFVANRKDKINVARFAYILSRAKPETDDKEISEEYKKFSDMLINWITNDKDAKELLTALKLYGYYSREESQYVSE